MFFIIFQIQLRDYPQKFHETTDFTVTGCIIIAEPLPNENGVCVRTCVRVCCTAQFMTVSSFYSITERGVIYRGPLGECRGDQDTDTTQDLL